MKRSMKPITTNRDKVKQALEVNAWAYVEGILSAPGTEEEKYLKLLEVLKVANTTPPASWVKMRRDYCVQYLREVTQLHIAVEVKAADLLQRVNSEERQASYRQALVEQCKALSSERLALVFKIVRIKMAFELAVKDPYVRNLMLDIVRIDFFRPHQLTSSQDFFDYLQNMIQCLSALPVPDLISYDLLHKNVEAWVTSQHRVFSPQEHHYMHYLYQKVLSLFQSAGFVLPPNDRALMQALNNASVGLSVNPEPAPVSDEREAAAKVLMALSGEDISEESVEIQAPKRVKLMGYPVVLFQPQPIQSFMGHFNYQPYSRK